VNKRSVPIPVVKLFLIAAAVAAVVVSSAVPGHADPSFGVRPGSSSGLAPGDVLNPAAGAPNVGPLGAPASVIGATALGLPATATVDDVSFGDDLFPPALPFFALFSVAPGSIGHPVAPPVSPTHPNINLELSAGDGSVAGDVYSSFNITGSGGPLGAFAPMSPPAPCGPIDSNIQTADENGLGPLALGVPNVGLGLAPGPAGDALNKLEIEDHSTVDFIPAGGDGNPDKPVFFTVDPATAAGLGPLPPFFGATTAADVLAWDPATSALYDWAPAGLLGIGLGDDIDALKVGYVSGAPISAGWIGAPDTVIFSFKPGSPSNAPLGSICYGPGTGTPGDVYQASGPFAGPMPVIDAEMLGLNTLRSGGTADDDLAAIDLVLATGSDTDGDMIDDAADFDIDGDGLGNSYETSIGTSPLVADTDGDGCGDGKELTFATLNPTNPWDFFSVPVPALFAAPDPTVVFKDSAVAAQDAQAVFAYFKAGAHTGTMKYEQDLNLNGVKDGIEYDRSVVGPAHSGPPDGTVSATDAQLAFAQFKLGYHC
jgi:hypothetical protein